MGLVLETRTERIDLDWTTQQPSIRVQWGTRAFNASEVIGALRETLDVLALCGPPFAGPWTILDPSSQDANGSRVDELADHDVQLFVERGVARNHDGQPFPKDGYGVSLVSTPREGVAAALRLHVGASVTRHIVNEVAVSLRAVEAGASADLRDTYGKRVIFCLTSKIWAQWNCVERRGRSSRATPRLRTDAHGGADRGHLSTTASSRVPHTRTSSTSRTSSC